MKVVAVLLSFWWLRRGRKAAVRRLRPYVERTRAALGAAAERCWTSDYGLGFLVTSVMLAARDVVVHLDQDALGLIQVDGWGELTGLDADLIGTRIALLSLDDDAGFAAGCRAALLFDGAFNRAHPHAGAEPGEADVSVSDAEGWAAGASTIDRIDLDALWDRLVVSGPPHLP